MSFGSWGNYPQVVQKEFYQNWVHESIHNECFNKGASVLPYGLGRSYGDVCLNDKNAILINRLNRFMDWNFATGELICESGVTLYEILQFSIPRGYFLSVTPGTQFVTLGGAIANDVHGKNHHAAGNFSHHVLCFELLRSDGLRVICSVSENAEMFRATVGGLGLTGFITWVKIKLQKIKSSYIDQEAIRFKNVNEFFELSKDSEGWPYTVSWIDCLATGESLGKGIFLRGRHAEEGRFCVGKEPRLRVPMDFPNFTLNTYTVKAFNFLYYWKQLEKHKKQKSNYSSFFYPLDAVLHWNRIYGKRGFFQYQCVVPYKNDNGEAIKEILKRVAESKNGTFLVVLKTFGKIESLGFLSFPREGVTLALDFPNSGEKVLKLFNELDRIVYDAGGALYPAKDARMSSRMFERSYPRLNEFVKNIDPKFSSSFWRRVRG